MRTCRPLFQPHPGSIWDRRFFLEDCLVNGLGEVDWFAPRLQTLVPGGEAALGFRVRQTIPMHIERQEFEVNALALMAPSGSYLLSTRLSWRGPSIFTQDDERIKVDVIARRLDIRNQKFFGLGSTTPRSAISFFGERLDVAGISGTFPLSTWLSTTASMSYVSPKVSGASGGTVPSIQDTYTSAAVPALGASTEFMDYQMVLYLHRPVQSLPQPPVNYLKVTYDWFQDLGPTHYNFDELEAHVNFAQKIEKEISTPRQPWGSNLICMAAADQSCTYGTLVLNGLVTLARATEGNSVPFYFQPTLGGVDSGGMDTLRGFDTGRFRAANRVLVQAEFDKEVWDPFGIYLFGDAGEVTSRLSDFNRGAIRYDVGGGLLLKFGNDIVARAYVAGGGGEGEQYAIRFTSAQ